MNVWLEDLVYQGDRKADFHPRAHLCILTDTRQVTGPLHVMITDLVHSCLTNYFLPHRDAASVSWIKRNHLNQKMLAEGLDKQNISYVGHLENLMEDLQQLGDADAVLFINADACAFIKTHRNSFLCTLATCLRSTTDKILILDMWFKPLNIL